MSGAVRLVDSIRAELAPVRERLLSHPYLAAVEQGRLEALQLRSFAGEQHAIISSDLRSVAHLVSRFGGAFFLDILAGERAALEALPPFAAALGMSEEDLWDYESVPGAQAYAAYMAWLAAYASDAEVAAAYLVNFEAWGENCGRLSRALMGRYGLHREQVAFFDLFAAPAGSFEKRALDVISGGLARGVSERLVRRAPRLLQGYELLYWDTLYSSLDSTLSGGP
ncbi:MAG: transcriptional regulator [Candidatus Dormibacteraeota bacterium]|uniref:Transcriptional regulator n=2 Tax=Candidatus Dormibacteraceae TaxID=3126998 RepID=A0A934NC11_9BACT|nr:transcriptional regulator [Candidatus Dormibacteraeota bacterium]MBJ7603488.1 transcriptional regulator [Candidatus Dormibacteraeota bacterium]